ncbi:alpha/beta hydrolase [Iodidimonas nitroreducens]|uniref:Alpha/beta hydrolase n=1 Tax=Iodidimonas nitroreducens TaxID=1236968 RepID=A0A5A7NBM1_9PROT|nr:alpha/beta fold hydrolase BchO [Iodidimonas nitroreducens]GAK32640.1 magnesium-chelatase 30 kDa subunit [alpha proteobacterium Q-1]GER05327.1 alpha/beta hydrolase [Iodidimonas nitroreducens]
MVSPFLHYPDFSIEGKNWPHRRLSRFVDVGGFRWHVQMAGPLEKGSDVERPPPPVFLLLHGTGASGHSFADSFAALAQDAVVIIPDLPGHGFTRSPHGFKMTLPQIAKALADLLGHLDQVPTRIIGHSAGAAIACQMVLDQRANPDRIIAINGALRPYQSRSLPVFSQFARLTARFLAENPVMPSLLSWRGRSKRVVEQLILDTGSRISAEGLAHYRALFSCSGHVAGALSMMAHWDLESLEKQLAHLSCPLILIIGDGDRAIPPDYQAKLAMMVPRAHLVHLPGLGHLAHEEDPDQIIALIVSEDEAVGN